MPDNPIPPEVKVSTEIFDKIKALSCLGLILVGAVTIFSGDTTIGDVLLGGGLAFIGVLLLVNTFKSTKPKK